MNWRTTMAHPGASNVGSVVGAGVGAHDVFHWERILASFIQLLSILTSIASTPLSLMVMTRHINDLQLELPSLPNSDGGSPVDGDSDGSGNSSNNSIAVSVVPVLVDCCIPPTNITDAPDCHRNRDCPCHHPHLHPCPHHRHCHRHSLL
jgi:hypothetical protein